MQVVRSQLQISLRTLQGFGASAFPYVGVKLYESKPYLYRGSESGYIQTLGYAEIPSSPVVVSLSHLQSSLSAIQGDEIDLSLDPSGMLKLSSVGEAYGAEIRVFTLRSGISWYKTLGPIGNFHVLPPNTFDGVILPSVLASPPVLYDRFLTLATPHGVVRKQIDIPNQKTSPRSEFLHVLSTTDHLAVSPGFWKAITGSFEVVVAGHTYGTELAKSYSGSHMHVAFIQADQMLYAITSATALAEKSEIILSPNEGFVVESSLGNSKFSLASDDPLPYMRLDRNTVKLLGQQLSKDREKDIELGEVSKGRYRLTRGMTSVTFISL
jgi:hypothetical protein